MKRILVILIVVLMLIIACSKAQNTEISETYEQDDTESYYTCPMHPTIVQQEPGSCPICGMDLVLENSSEREEKEADSRSIYIDPVVVQNMGIRIDHVARKDIIRNIRTIGKVELADDRSYSLNLKYSGWIEKIYADKTGMKISKGDPLFQIYSPEIISAQEEYLNAVKTFGKDSDLARSSARRLQLWSIPSSHLQQIVAEDNAQKNPEIYTPLSGFVLHKTIQQGSFVQAGKDLYHIGNLDKIWIMAEIYEFDIPFLKSGSIVNLELTNIPGRKLLGYIDYIYPILSEKTRTQKIRIELDNKDHEIKPGMFATLNIESEVYKNVLAVPSEAIIRSGNKQIVFVSSGNGKYEAKEITAGVTDDLDGFTQIIEGLNEQDVVVTSGQFLLDSESQLREAVQKLLNTKLENKSEISSAGEIHSHESYFTCPMHPTIVQDEEGECPICGMDLVEKK